MSHSDASRMFFKLKMLINFLAFKYHFLQKKTHHFLASNIWHSKLGLNWCYLYEFCWISIFGESNHPMHPKEPKDSPAICLGNTDVVKQKNKNIINESRDWIVPTCKHFHTSFHLTHILVTDLGVVSDLSDHLNTCGDILKPNKFNLTTLETYKCMVINRQNPI